MPYQKGQAVAPRAGAWIEIPLVRHPAARPAVAPRAGAWIEIKRLPYKGHGHGVAPRAGAWIEIIFIFVFLLLFFCRPPCGGVD